MISKKGITTLFSLLLVTSLSVAVVATQQQQAAYAQTIGGGDRGVERLTSIPATVAADGTFQNVDDGIRLKVPTGWGIKDIDNNDPANMGAETILGFGILASVCDTHSAGLGGTTECNVTPESMEVNIMRIPELDQRPDVQNLILSQGKTMTIQDLLIIYQEKVLGFVTQFDDIRVATTTPTPVNITDAAGATQSTTEGLIVEWEHTTSAGTPVKMFSLLVLSPDKNTGYAVSSAAFPISRMPTITPEVAQIFDSFELIVP